MQSYIISLFSEHINTVPYSKRRAKIHHRPQIPNLSQNLNPCSAKPTLAVSREQRQACCHCSHLSLSLALPKINFAEAPAPRPFSSMGIAWHGSRLNRGFAWSRHSQSKGGYAEAPPPRPCSRKEMPWHGTRLNRGFCLCARLSLSLIASKIGCVSANFRYL